ncbi:MAG TPA: methionyl-tRNA formyltransferase [Verrucomicrobiae bacterium]|nr:methionyl-tRNA formyltransferase [Verrucomicrobiae bacterium]
MKLILAGTTEFGIPAFEKIVKNFSVPLVITQPDRPTGRKQILTPSEVKLWAEKKGLPIKQPEKISELQDFILDLNPDLMLVAAYGQIIPKNILDIPKFGSINIHGSILPKYRGASPIQAAILNGETETGITLIKMDEKMDHGPILSIKKATIDENETFVELHKRLSHLASENIVDTLTAYLENKLNPEIQDHKRATYTKLLTKEDGRIRWTSPAIKIHQQIRALNPEPGTWSILDDKSVKILRTAINRDNKIELPGKIYRKDNDMLVKCSDFSLIIKEIQPEGKKPMTGVDFLNGLKNLETKIFV